jgi:AcrR family transcriptional regulator
VEQPDQESSTRRKTRAKIVAVAKNLFLRNGVIELPMQEIADACEITRTTLYDYFSNKNEILLAVVYEGLLELYGFDLPMPTYLSGFEKLRLFVQALFDRFLEKRHVMRLLLAYYQTTDPALVNEQEIQQTIVTKQQGYVVFRIIQEGIEDGTVSDENTEAKFRVVMEHILALGYRYALRDDGFIGWKTGLDQKILRQSIDAVLEILRPGN